MKCLKLQLQSLVLQACGQHTSSSVGMNLSSSSQNSPDRPSKSVARIQSLITTAVCPIRRLAITSKGKIKILNLTCNKLFHDILSPKFLALLLSIRQSCSARDLLSVGHISHTAVHIVSMSYSVLRETHCCLSWRPSPS